MGVRRDEGKGRLYLVSRPDERNGRSHPSQAGLTRTQPLLGMGVSPPEAQKQSRAEQRQGRSAEEWEEIGSQRDTQAGMGVRDRRQGTQYHLRADDVQIP